MECVISLDAGTTGVKAALIDREGRILGRAYHRHETRVDGARVEQDPTDWYEGACSVIASVAEHRSAGAEVAALVLSGQMQDLIPLGADDVLGSAILYSDARAQKQARMVEDTVGAEELARTTGNLQDAASLLAKLLWLKEEEPARWASARHVLFGAHDYISWKLTGRAATDFTTLSTTGLLDIRANTYAVGLLDVLGIPHALLPQLTRAEERDGGLCPEATARLGLPSGLPVFHGTGDVGSTTIATGAGLPGTLSCYLGTSGWLAATSDGGIVDPQTGIYNLRHPDPRRIINVGPMLTAAGGVDWAIRVMGPQERGEQAFSSFTREAASAPPASAGILFLPYLAGERSPFRDASARGGFLGLTASTSRPEMYRAVLEGVAFAMRTIHDAAGAALGEVHRISLSGGGARSTLWPQVFADVFGCPVVVPSGAEDAGLVGAFVIGAKAMGWLSDYVPPAREEAAVFDPVAGRKAAYDAAYGVFRGLYPALRGSFAALEKARAGDRRSAGPR